MVRALALVLLSSASAAAPLGTTITYQGQLQQDGDMASGSYDFQLCLFDSPASPTGGLCVPDFADVPVTRGVFALDLDFGPATFSGQQRYLEIRVRDGASTGDYAVLTPRQPLRAAPEALHAVAVPWLGIADMPAGFADGSDDRGVTQISAGAGLDGGTISSSGTLSVAPAGIVQSMLAAGAVGPGQLASGAVGPSALQANAVTGAALADASVSNTKLAAQAVDSPQLAPGAVTAAAVADSAITTTALADASVTRPKIAPGAVGAEQIDPAQVQARISGSCAAGQYVRGISAAGTLICDVLPVPITRTLEVLQYVAPPTAADFTALALTSDGRPLVAYYDTRTRDLRLYVCADAACSSSVSGSPRTLDSDGDVGNWVSMAMRPGDLPLIAYYDATNADLKIYDCDDTACSSGTARTADGTGSSVGGMTSIAIRADGRGVVAYYSQTGTDLKLYFCADANCSTGAPYLAHSEGYIGQGNSLVLRPNGVAGVLHYAIQTGNVFYNECTDLTCTDMVGGRLRQDGGSQGPYSALVLRADGRPLGVMSTDSANVRTLVLSDCQSATCAGTSQPSRVIDEPGVGEGVSMAIGPDGAPVMSYYDRSNGALKYYRCADANCTAGGAHTVDDIGNVGLYTSLAIRTDGRPVISYWDVGRGALKLHICATPECR